MFIKSPSTSNFLCLDIGEGMLKAVLVNINTFTNQLDYLYCFSTPTTGIYNGTITNAKQLCNNIWEVIQHIQLETFISISDIAITFSLDQSIAYIEKSLNQKIYGRVMEKHLPKMEHQNILGVLQKYYDLDNMKMVDNPLSMYCQQLITYHKYIAISETFWNNLQLLFAELGLNLIYVASNIILLKNIIENNNVIIDFGKKKSRVLSRYDHRNQVTFFDFGLENIQEHGLLWPESYDPKVQGNIEYMRHITTHILQQCLPSIEFTQPIHLLLCGAVNYHLVTPILLESFFGHQFSLYELPENALLNCYMNVAPNHFMFCILLAKTVGLHLIIN